MAHLCLLEALLRLPVHKPLHRIPDPRRLCKSPGCERRHLEECVSPVLSTQLGLIMRVLTEQPS